MLGYDRKQNGPSSPHGVFLSIRGIINNKQMHKWRSYELDDDVNGYKVVRYWVKSDNGVSGGIQRTERNENGSHAGVKK